MFEQISLIDTHPAEALELLRAGKIDVAVIFRYDETEPEPDGVRLHHLLDDPVLWDGKTSRATNRRCYRRARTRLASVHDPRGLATAAPGPCTREPAAAPPARCPHPSDSNTTACSASQLGQAALDPGSPLLCRLA